MSARFLILPQNSRHRKNDGACSRRRCQHGTITTRLYAKIQASGIETGDHWQHPTAQVARDLGITLNLLRRWKQEIPGDPIAAFPGKKRRKPHEAELARLTQELARVTQERDFLKKCGGLLHQGGAIKFAFIATGLGIWLAGWLCEAHGISRAGFYVWRTRPRVSGRGPTSSA